MTRLINLSQNDDHGMYIDPATVTMISLYKEEKDGQQKDTLMVYTSEGRQIWADTANWNIDPVDVMDKMKQAGAALSPLPLHESNGKLAQFISPAAVTYATLTTADEDGKMGAILGVKGYGRVESYDSRETEITDLIAAVRAKKKLLEYKPEEYTSRWYNAGALYIDPAAVTQIREEGGDQIRIEFEDTRDIDIHPVINTEYPSMATYARLLNEGMSDTEAHRELKRLGTVREAECKAAFGKLIDDILADNDTLTFVSGKNALYVRKEEIAWISLHNEENRGGPSATLRKHDRGNDRLGDSISVYFNTVTERTAALKPLGLEPPQPGKKPSKKFDI